MNIECLETVVQVRTTEEYRELNHHTVCVYVSISVSLSLPPS